MTGRIGRERGGLFIDRQVGADYSEGRQAMVAERGGEATTPSRLLGALVADESRPSSIAIHCFYFDRAPSVLTADLCVRGCVGALLESTEKGFALVERSPVHARQPSTYDVPGPEASSAPAPAMAQPSAHYCCRYFEKSFNSSGTGRHCSSVQF